MLKLSILLLWLSAVFDPVGQVFNIRYIAIFLALFFVFKIIFFDKIRLNNNGLSFRSLLILFFGFATPLYGLLIYSFYAGSEDFIDTSYIAAGLLIFTSVLYKNEIYCLHGIRSFLISTRLLALAIISVLTTQLISSSDWYWVFVERQVAYIGLRAYGDVNFPYIYFVASPLLIFLVAYEVNMSLIKSSISNLCFLITSILALFLSGTRFNMLVSMVFLLSFISIKFGVKKVFAIYFIIGLTCFYSLHMLSLGDIFNNIFSSSEESNSVKLSYFEAYFKIFSNPVNLVLGQGYNAHGWSSEFREMLPLDYDASKTELTYLEFFRVYGIIWGVAFLLLIIFLLREVSFLNIKTRWIYYGLITFLVSASLNPYIFSVNGMLPLALISSILVFANKLNLFAVYNLKH